MPEAPVHHFAAHHLTLLLEAWAQEQSDGVKVLRNLALRFLQDHPTTGIDPDVCVLSPAPADLDTIGSLCLWKPGHVAPPICFEIVSVNHPYKDYSVLQDRYAALGTQELVVFDPLLAGPRSLGGPVALQLWRRHASGPFERVHFESTPAYSEVLDAWLIPDGRLLAIAHDRLGKRRWQTDGERAQDAARQAQDAARQAQDTARQAQSEAERARLDAARERARREELERLVRELESKSGR